MPMTEEARKQLAESNRQRIWTEEARKKISDSSKGRHTSDETRAKMSATRKGRKCGPMSLETKEKIRQANLGRKASPETKAKLSAARKGKIKGPNPWLSEANRNRVWTAEDRGRVSARSKGKPASPETKAKMSTVRKGVLKSEETKQRMSDSWKDLDSPANVSRREATSRCNVRRNLSGQDFNVKGYHDSPKSKDTPVAYRSVGIELRLMVEFDADPKVVSWESPLTIRYTNSKGVHKHTLPDFLLTFVDGTKHVIEGKGPHLLDKYLAGEKFVAVREWCLSEGVAFSVVTSERDHSLRWVRVV